MPRKKKTPPAPTDEQVRALIDSQPWEWQSRLFWGFVADPHSSFGSKIRALVSLESQRGDYYEYQAGLQIEQIDPQGLLRMTASDKEIAKKLGYANDDTVKSTRNRMKNKIAKKAAVPIHHADTR
jgi:hypothetical protein